ncbi:hypothetical protein B9Z55_028750 [Caenorhabditis nigoni]|uniref:RNA-directed DNA polymerase n=1 Tax=Caenorhabditis nigoni TaxID=1611254 RepID=A0A2G5SA60_9PELO|nr:hypothetical protein B9Z55_028750 [Caenorhabditis nigoni]
MPNGYYQSQWGTGKTSETAILAMMQQMHMQNQLPDPPKYTAEENSASMDAFIKTFQMKYGGLSQKQQVVLLESNFLSGKALKVYKGLPEYDKQSFQTVMRRMAERLRVSKEDDSRRAKSKWEQLHKRDGQSIEDYCLAIDEHSKRAFVRIEPEELSSLKCQKLMNAVYDNEMMSGLIESKLSETTEIDHYEVAREIAIRYGRSAKERQKNRKKEEAREKKDNNSSLPNNQYQQNSSKMWSQKQNQNRNHQQLFKSPSNNYQANPSNNNYQFTSVNRYSPSPPLVQQFSSSIPSSPSNQSSFNSQSPSACQTSLHINQSSPTSPFVQQSSPIYQSSLHNQFPPHRQNSQREEVSNQGPSAQAIPVNNNFACRECNAIGCHAPTCSKAPRNPKYVPTCNHCREKGHSANYCPNLNKDNKSVPNQNTVNKISTPTQNVATVAVVESNEVESVDTTVNSAETAEVTKIQYEKGNIAGVDVTLMLDSGACISVMSLNLWESIVEMNGKEWEKDVKKETPSIQNVVAANGEPIKLLFEATLETAMRSRTRKIPICVANVPRNTVILGSNNFEEMGIQLSIDEQPREVRMTYNVRLAPKSHRIIEVHVEGIVGTEKSCLIYPIIEQLAPALCQVSNKGKTFLTLSNSSENTVFLQKGEIIARGEIEGFKIVKEESLEEILEGVSGIENTSIGNELCSVKESEESSGDHWKLLCEQLQRKPVMEEEERRVWDVIKTYQDIFAVNDDELGKAKHVEGKIELLDGAEPIRQKPRPIPLAVREQVKEMLKKMLKQGVITESTSPWSSPVVLVKKKDGSIRMCIDYRKVNKVVKQNAHPLPHIEATLQSLAGKTVFTTLDMLAGFWQVLLEKQSQQITAFAVGSELFEWTVVPFGLVTSPAIFQAAMEAVVGDLLGKCAFVYVDDLLIASKNMEEHEKDVKAVLERVRISGMKLKASKCFIAKLEVQYLGHLITPNGVKTDEAKVEKMKKFSRPTNVKELQSFLGLVGYYRKFIWNFAKIAFCLFLLTGKKLIWTWNEEQEEAFQKLLHSVCTAPVLMQPDCEAALDGTRPFCIYTDASRQGVGAVLAQEAKDGQQHPIAFASKSLTPAETRYHVTDLEALAMVFALKRFKTIIYGTKVLVYTDHKPLIYLLKGSVLSDRLLRWSMDVLEFNVQIIYLQGKANVVADALSRGGCPPIESENTETAEMTRVINAISALGKEEEVTDPEILLNIQYWLEWLRQEEGWKELVRILESGEVSGKVVVPGIKGEVAVESYAVVGKTLRNIEKEEMSRLVVPQKVKLELIRETHEGGIAGHFGAEKMFRQLNKRFFWPRMRVDLENFAKSCSKCLCTNDHTKLISPLTPYKVSAPLEIVACDLIDVGISSQGNRYILTIIDLFTKYASAVPIPDKKAETVLKAFIERWALGEGRIPSTLLTDLGKEFVNEHFQKFTKMLGIKHITTKGYNSRANGAVERFNKTLVSIMKKRNTVPYEWDDQVAFAVFAYNSSVHSTTGESPLFLTYGRDPKGPLEKGGDAACGISYVDVDEYKHLLVQELKKAYQLVEENTQGECERYKQFFDQKNKTLTRNFPQPGSRVLVEIPSEKLGARCPKLVNKWQGMYRVVSCSENSATLLPIMGKASDILSVPFEHLRVVPPQMEDKQIDTTKRRAKLRAISDSEGNGIHTISKFSVHTNSDNFSMLYHCRCPKACHFVPPGYRNVGTTSPVIFHRMMELLKTCPELKNIPDPSPLYILASKPTTWIPTKPSKETLLILSKCPSLELMCSELRGWDEALREAYEETITEHVSSDIQQGHLKSLVVYLPGVLQSEAPLHHSQRKLILAKEDTAVDSLYQEVSRHPLNKLILLMPFSNEESTSDFWNGLLSVVPKEVEVLIVPPQVKIPDATYKEAYLLLFKRLQRRHGGSLRILFPDTPVPDFQNKALCDISDFLDSKQYWDIVGTLMKDANIVWPKYNEVKPSTWRQEDNPSSSSSNAVVAVDRITDKKDHRPPRPKPYERGHASRPFKHQFKNK